MKSPTYSIVSRVTVDRTTTERPLLVTKNKHSFDEVERFTAGAASAFHQKRPGAGGYTRPIRVLSYSEGTAQTLRYFSSDGATRPVLPSIGTVWPDMKTASAALGYKVTTLTQLFATERKKWRAEGLPGEYEINVRGINICYDGPVRKMRKV